MAAAEQLVTHLQVGTGDAAADSKVTAALTAALEGAARIVAQLPDGEQVGKAQQLCRPMVAQLQALAGSAHRGSRPHAISVAHSLHLIAAVLRFLDIRDSPSAASEAHPVVQVPSPPSRVTSTSRRFLSSQQT